jgi:pSer/pThr/pTyr-binding forkhead associated (FHA) protein
VPLPVGDFLVGRNQACDLVVQDGMVSRRHAVLHVSADRVVVEDLGSRNGIRVNGVPVTGARQVEHGERIAVGSYELVVLENSRQRGERRQTRPAVRRSERTQTPVATPAARGSSPGRGGAGAESSDEETEADRRSVYHVLLETCEANLAEGRLRELEGAARNLTASVRGGLLRGRPPSEETTRKLVDLALRVVEQHGIHGWLEAAVELYATLDRVMEADAVERICQLGRRGQLRDVSALRSYVGQLRARAHRMNEDERMRLDRLDALTRLIS